MNPIAKKKRGYGQHTKAVLSDALVDDFCADFCEFHPTAHPETVALLVRMGIVRADAVKRRMAYRKFNELRAGGLGAEKAREKVAEYVAVDSPQAADYLINNFPKSHL
jgi:hypothetical protein